MFFTNSILISYFIHDYQSKSQEKENAYLLSASERIEHDLSLGTEHVVNAFLHSNNYYKYINPSAYPKAKNQLLLQLQELLRQEFLLNTELFTDSAIYYNDTEELISAVHGYLQLSREANHAYKTLYNTVKIEALPGGLNSRVVYNNISGSQHNLNIIYCLSNDVSIVLPVNQNYYSDLFLKDFTETTAINGIFISDSDGNTIFHNGIEPKGWKQNKVPVNKLGSNYPSTRTGFKDSANDSYLYFSKRIDSLNIIILKIQRDNLITGLRSYSRLLTLFGILILFTIALGTLITYFYSTKCYVPIKNLISNINTDNHVPSTQANELEVISQYIQTSKSKISEMENMLSSNRLVIKEKYVKYLLTNEEPEKRDINEYCTVLKLEFPYPYYTSVCCLLDPISLSKQSFTDRNLLLLQIVHQIESNCVNQNLIIIAGEYTDNTIGIVLNGNHEEDIISAIHQINKLVSEFLETNWNIPFFISSGSVEHCLKLSKSFARALSDSIYHFYQDLDNTIHIFNSQTALSIDNEAISDIHIASATLIQGLRSDSKKFNNVLQQLHKTMSSGDLTLEEASELLTLLSHKCLAIANSNPSGITSFETEKLLNPQQYFWSINDYFSFIKGCIMVDPFPKEKDTVEINVRINHYINDHLADDLSLEIISDNFQLNPKYLSRVYKDLQGENISSYIQNQRIEYAKQLLKDTSKTIIAISEKVGFSSSGYFIRCFHTKTGMTPNTYREMLSD